MTVRVLVVDDNVELAENLAEILNGEGYVVTVCGDPEAAIAIAEREEVDVALLDVRMPGMDGVALHAHLAARLPRATFVLMTAYSTDDRIEVARRAGIRDVLPKPLPIDRLLAAMPAPEATDRQVLVVEDDDALRSSILELLRERGYDAEGASDLASARMALELRAYAATVLDVHLADGDGAAFAQELVSTRAMAIVLITGIELTPTMRELLEPLPGPPVVVLQKPFDPERLLATLRGLEGAT
jgi:DNA-binding NtrC family response regulator